MLFQAERLLPVRPLGPIRGRAAEQFDAVPIPDGATHVDVFIDRTGILNTKAKVLVTLEMSLDGVNWGGEIKVQSRDLFKEPNIAYPLSLQCWIDGIDETPPGVSKDSGFGVELPPGTGRLIRSSIKSDTDVDLGVYYKFDDPPPRKWADLTPKG